MLIPFTALGSLAKKIPKTNRFKSLSELTFDDIELSMEIKRAKEIDKKRFNKKRYV
jgi:hypothetical protein